MCIRTVRQTEKQPDRHTNTNDKDRIGKRHTERLMPVPACTHPHLNPCTPVCNIKSTSTCTNTVQTVFAG